MEDCAGDLEFRCAAAEMTMPSSHPAFSLKLRPFESADLPRVMEIYTASIRSLAAPYYSPEQIAAWAPDPPDAVRWAKRLAPLHTFVAEVDGVLAGFASCTLDGYLDFLFTHPAFVRRGVASALYLRVEATLRVAGISRVFTHASLAARPFFDRYGFQVDAEECVECRGAYLRRFAMHRPLQNDGNT
jgi:putative acetyltransferase